MMRLLLVRHASCAHVGRALAGRAPGVCLDERGRAEAGALGSLLSRAHLTEVVSSPMERARETASPIARAQGLEVRVEEAFNEIDYGEWTGLGFERLNGRPEWIRWNEARSTARVPGGEAMADVLERALGGVHDLAARHAGGQVAAVSHCDVIRALLSHFLGLSVDRMLRLEIAPASVSTVEIAPWGARVLEVNRAPSPPWDGRQGAPGAAAR